MTKYNFDDLMSAVCNHYYLTEKDLIGRDRKAHLIEARHMMMFMCVRELGMSLSETGRMMQRTHATVRHAYEKLRFHLTSKEKKDYDKIMDSMPFIQGDSQHEYRMYAQLGKLFPETIKHDFQWGIKALGKHPRCFDVIYTEI